ncbi:orc1/cdc6 family replication initiation protein [Halocalculus aciditolerans]|uniref:ORC1-type DNA replication protein n=1 Tax=Halocalculus aciditolerans TaxID=1383812 RepID=A0A830FII7_9EURY|nr:orc1/cdc6 family replication initiation protein [Halocalculus aciditolerans]GGL56115.1 cell division control protein Cdc6 [Halocalculus aciditolerans]
MGGPFADIDDTLFANKDALSEEYQPDTILERNDEIDQFRNALTDVLFGRNPKNVFLYGKAGVGKTAVTKYMLDALQDEVATREEADELYVHNHNCNGDSAFAAVRALVNQLYPDDDREFPKRGLGLSDAFAELYQEMDRIGGTHLIVLDEIDHLDDANDVLYELPRARANGHLDEARVGVIGISNNYSFRQRLSAKVKDSLMEHEISFSTYDATELCTILEDRATLALIDDAYEPAVIAKCAAHAAKDSGSARQAIDLLRAGAEVAEEGGDGTVTEAHIERGRDRAQRGRLRDKIEEQTMHGQLVLEAIARLEADGETPVRSKRAMDVYQTVATEYGEEPLTTLKSIQNHLSDLSMLGFLVKTERNDGRAGGIYFEYELSLEPDIVFDVRADAA